jgi:hypothetical protein
MHIRRRPTVEIPISDLHVPEDIKLNDPLVQLYLKLHRGKINVSLTCLPISCVTSGYYEREADSTALVRNVLYKHVPNIERAIRRGDRPTLDVYWSAVVPGGGGYVCADDETVLTAYSRLNFAFVPCRVLRPKKVEAPEASIWLEKHGERVQFKKAVAPTVDTYASFVGSAYPPFGEIVRALIHKCEATRSGLVSFHQKDASGVHYHQMLHAFLRRHERVLDSISRLARSRTR